MSASLELQVAVEGVDVPRRRDLECWISAALNGTGKPAELTVRVVDEAESRALNLKYRAKDAATNVLSFPAGLPEDLDLPLLGDLVICAPLVAREAAEQSKLLDAHWAHLVVHGVLHLLGYDHQREDDARRMEAREVEILSRLGYANPYVGRPTFE